MKITLTWSELLIAHQIAAMRRVQNMKLKTAHKYGRNDPINLEEGSEISAIRGEMAVAKAFNCYWMGTVGQYGVVDVGGKIEVRTVTQASHKLILHPEDKDQYPFVLVNAGSCPEVELMGWMYGKDGKDEKYWDDPTKTNRPAYFIPRSDLRPMSELVELNG